MRSAPHVVSCARTTTGNAAAGGADPSGSVDTTRSSLQLTGD
jgi:hypothetical protein